MNNSILYLHVKNTISQTCKNLDDTFVNNLSQYFRNLCQRMILKIKDYFHIFIIVSYQGRT